MAQDIGKMPVERLLGNMTVNLSLLAKLISKYSNSNIYYQTYNKLY